METLGRVLPLAWGEELHREARGLKDGPAVPSPHLRPHPSVQSSFLHTCIEPELKSGQPSLGLWAFPLNAPRYVKP